MKLFHEEGRVMWPVVLLYVKDVSYAAAASCCDARTFDWPDIVSATDAAGSH